MRGSKKSFVAAIVVAFLILTVFSTEARAVKKIGIIISTESQRYIDSYKGIMDEFTENGLKEPNVQYTIVRAGGNNAKIMEAVRNFAENKTDIIIAIGTNAAITTAKHIKKIPIVFSTVNDPVQAGIAKNRKSSGNNTTGSSPLLPLPALVKGLKEIIPLKKLAVIYTRGEKNTETHLANMQKLQNDFKIRVVPVMLNTKADVPVYLEKVLLESDAVYVTGSTITIETIDLIVQMAAEAKVATITHRDDFVEKGVLLGVSENAYALGRVAGGKALKVLKGEKPSSIPIESTSKIDFILNLKTAKAGQFKIPPAFMKRVTKIIK